MTRWLDQFFELAHHQTTVRREAVAGLTTFFTMAYIVAVNPAILKTAGMPAGASLTATILTAIFRRRKADRKRGEMARPDRRAGRSYGDDAGLIQSDESEKQSDADSITVTKRGRSLNHPLAEAE